MHARVLAGALVVQRVLVDAAEGRIELTPELALVARLGREIDDAQDSAVRRRQDSLLLRNTISTGNAHRSLLGPPDVDGAITRTCAHVADRARRRILHDVGVALRVVAGDDAPDRRQMLVHG